MSERGSRIGRRDALRAAGVGAAGVAVVGAQARALASEPARGAVPAWALGPRERALSAHALHPLDASARRALEACEAAGVEVVEAFAPRHGGLPFVVEIRQGHPDAGARLAFELVRDDPEGPTPIAAAAGLALLLHNRGDGSSASRESDARLARRMASALAPVASALGQLHLTTVRARASCAPFATLHVPTRPGEG
jgi:hypothetical protein